MGDTTVTSSSQMSVSEMTPEQAKALHAQLNQFYRKRRAGKKKTKPVLKPRGNVITKQITISMDIRPKQTTSTEQTSSQPQQAKDETKFKVGSVPHASGRLMIPPAIQTTLTSLGAKYGFDFDLNELALDGTMAEKVKTTRKIVELAKADSKLLNEMMKLIKSLMKSELKLADFHRKLVKEAIRFNVQMDKQTADIFLQMAGYKAKSAKLEHRTNLRNELKEKRTTAYNNYYSTSVYGSESELIDVEFETLASNQKILSEGKGERIKLDGQRKQKLASYVQSAYQN